MSLTTSISAPLLNQGSIYLCNEKSQTLYTEDDPYQDPPDELIHKALAKLSKSGVQLILWGSLLLRHHNVPKDVKDCDLLIPDEQFDSACKILTDDLHLSITPSSNILSKTSGELHTTGLRFRVTRSARLGSMQCIHLFPASFASFQPEELLCHQTPTFTLYTARASAFYAALLRLISRYPTGRRERCDLLAQLEMLVNYDLLHTEKGYVDDAEWEELGMDANVEAAVSVIRGWTSKQEWRTEEAWMSDVLLEMVRGTLDTQYLP